MNILAVIPARGGSKGFPRKNLALLNGITLVARALESASKVKKFCDVVLSSECHEILEQAKYVKGVMALERDPSLAEDNTPSAEVALAVLHQYANLQKKHPTHVMWLQPTSPLRNADDIKAAIELMKRYPKALSLISTYDAVSVHPNIMYRAKGDFGERIWNEPAVQRRQDFTKIHVRNGAIYLVCVDYLKSAGRLFDEAPLLLEMPRDRSINIDEPLDLLLAETLMREAR